MIYPSDFEDKIGFTPLRALLKENCESVAGKECVDLMRFSFSRKFVRASLSQTAEMLSAIEEHADIPSAAVPHLKNTISEIAVEGSFVPAAQVWALRSFLAACSDIQHFCCRGQDGSNPRYPSLSSLFSEMPLFPDVVSEIDRIINRFGEVKDNATPRLHEIVRDIASLSGTMSSIVRRIMAKAVNEGLIDKDTAPAMRDGRPVIPVPASHKRSINGIVHDVSATGKTSFIEPAEVVEAGNRLRELEMERHREEVLILTELCSKIRPYAEEMERMTRLAGLYDFIIAKAKVAQITHAQMPVIEKKPEFEWYHAVHPTLQLALEKQGREVVPFNLDMTRQQRFIVISGPNAGGKSVTLKTVGVVQYMMQCGLLPTVRDNSHMGLVHDIFIDIGDQQSIENDLSTYSSHLRNMKHFLKNATDSSLVLIDEIGSGTEPQIGSALAQAILKRLGELQCFGVVTTHYQNIKTFADHTEGFVNGAMLYDRQNFQPLFQLSVGHPGSSFAIEIARSIGLPKEIVDDAKEIVGSDYVNMDKYLLDIARDRRYWANKRLSIKEKEHKIDTVLEDYENKAEALRRDRTAILREAREEAKNILAGTNATIERTIHEIKKAQAERDKTKQIRTELEEYRRQVNDSNRDDHIPEVLKPKVRQKKKNTAHANAAVMSDRPLAVGDYVKMKDGGVTGRIISITGKKGEVAFGSLRTIVDISRLKAAEKPKESAATQSLSVTKSTSDDIRARQLKFKQDIDVRGMRADEALQAVTYFIDDAVQFSAHRLRILHGTGTGALRTAIRQWLSANPAVSSYRDEDVRLGGAGITIVELE